MAEVAFALALLWLAGGTFVALDSYATMMQINATGPAGVALGQDAYQAAAFRFALGGVGSALGVGFVIAAAVEAIKYHLYELFGEN